jgi:hypothetical protein
MARKSKVSDSDHGEGVSLAEPVVRVKTFAAGEIACEVCARANPPNRSQCLYCGSGLPGGVPAPNSISVEQTESPPQRGTFCLSAKQLQSVGGDVLAELAHLVGAKIEDLSAAIAAGGVLPLPVASDLAQGEKLRARIRQLELEPFEFLQEDTDRFRKIRGLDLSAGLVGAVPPAEDFAYGWSDLVLIVIGRIVTTRIEIDEKRHGSKSKQLDARQFSSDELLMDLYFKAGDAWRVYGDNFDYSCLGERKAVTGFENFGRLLDLIKERTPSAEIDKTYAKKRALLASVWPLEEENRQIVSFAGKRKQQQSTTTNNESQFNKYSRAAYLLKMNSGERAE